MNKNILPWRIYQRIVNNNKIDKTAYIHHNVELGRDNVIYNYASIGRRAEHKKPEAIRGITKIGSKNVIREFVTINASTTGETWIGHNNWFLAHSHVGHDAKIFNDNVISCGAKIGGHSVIFHNVYIGLNAVLHQMTIVHSKTIVGASAFVKGDLLPNSKYAGVPAKRIGDNNR